MFSSGVMLLVIVPSASRATLCSFDDGLRARISAERNECSYSDLSLQWDELVQSAHAVAEQVLPNVTVRAHRPWIRATTLRLIEERSVASLRHDQPHVQKLSSEIRRSAKIDRRVWLEERLLDNDWSEIRKLRKGGKQLGRLKNASGEFVSSEARAETLADHYERIQWSVRPTAPSVSNIPLGPEIAVELGPIQWEELQRAAKHLRTGRAAGLDDLPGEFWRLIAVPGSCLAEWALEFCQRCWREKRVPHQWHLARVAAIFKGGNSADCSNYRPISLLNVAYKMFAHILLERLKQAGAEQRIRATQYGFRSNACTADALFIARRAMDAAWADRNGSLLLLALDWSKAFDCISPQKLMEALRRFGLPDSFIQMVEAIYQDRRFTIREEGHDSSWRRQSFGISQGCPLSPFLFVLAMSVLLKDAEDMFVAEVGHERPPYIICRDILYADDTLILESDARRAERFMHIIAEVGSVYGLALNWMKVKLLRINHGGSIIAPTGEPIKVVDSLLYLGATLQKEAHHGAELSRRVGLARKDFDCLASVWSHAGISRKRKCQIYDACIVSKLLYGVQTIWLNKGDRRRLDAVHCMCLRRCCGIPHSYVSRISNAEVFFVRNVFNSAIQSDLEATAIVVWQVCQYVS